MAGGNAASMSDPKVERVARIYADAFLSATPKDQWVEQLDEFRSFVNDICANQPRFVSILESSFVTSHDKVELLKKTVCPSTTVNFGNFLCVLAEHERLPLLSAILRQTELEFEHRTGKGRVQLRTAQPLSTDKLEDIRRQLAKSLPFDPILEVETEPRLLGGLVIQVGDTVYDGSLRTRLKQLRDRLRQRSLHEIQSGRDRFSHS